MAGIVGGNTPACGDGSVRPERAGGVLPRPRADRARAAVISQAGFTAIDDLVHGFGGGYLPPVMPRTGPKARGRRVNGGPPGSRTRSALDRPHRVASWPRSVGSSRVSCIGADHSGIRG